MTTPPESPTLTEYFLQEILEVLQEIKKLLPARTTTMNNIMLTTGQIDDIVKEVQVALVRQTARNYRT